MIKRYLSDIAFSKEFGRQMRFVTGPRQAGKTTLAKEFLDKQNCLSLYYNWDQKKIRDRYRQDAHFFVQDLYKINPIDNKRWLCLDEIHKYPKWKNLLKDFFDSYGEENGFIVTGSARLDMLRKSGDSLAGRYFTFRLNPVTLGELSGRSRQEPPLQAADWVESRLNYNQDKKEALGQLLEFSGFPEPLLAASSRFHHKWQDDYVERLVQEDLRDLTRIQELGNIITLMQLLPSKISAPLSINSLAEDMRLHFSTVAKYLKTLELGLLLFRVPPYSKKISRSITKEHKVYFYDWTRLNDPAARFENYVAVEIKAMLELWTDAGLANFEMRFIRDRDGKETDFLILRDNRPWLLMEVKLTRTAIDYHHKKNSKALSGIPFVQIVKEPEVVEKREDHFYQMSAACFF
jgi:hypothetical protein